MLKERTLFIIGAGAGVDVKMPLGTDLRSEITNRLAFTEERPPLIDRIFRDKFSKDYERYRIAAKQIEQGLHLSKSIDSFLHNRSSDDYIIQCGKIAIAQTILEYESISSLAYDRFNEDGPDLTKASNTWLAELFSILQEGVTDTKIGKLFENIAFINFNYDRCLEVYLLKAAITAYGLRIKDAADLVNGINIIHPYGSLGPLEWQKSNLSAVPFGTKPSRELLEISGSLRTYTEQVDNLEVIAKISHEMNLAHTIVFLGFAFHQQNMKLLGKSKNARHVYATLYQIPEPARPMLLNRIDPILVGGTRATTSVALDCRTFLQHYALHLSK